MKHKLGTVEKVNLKGVTDAGVAAGAPAVRAVPQPGQHIAFYLEDLRGGGVQRMTLIIAGALAERGHRVELVTCSREGPLYSQIPAKVKLHELSPVSNLLARAYALVADPGGLSVMLRPLLLPLKLPRTLCYLPALARYLCHERPDTLFAATPYLNIVAVLARRLAGVTTRLVISERTHLSTNLAHSGSGTRDWRRRYLPPLMQHAYLQADAIIAVSDGVADDLAEHIGIPRQTITRIYNPTFLPDLPERAKEAIEHPWFTADALPVVLSVGRLGRQKDFSTLLRAFARVRSTRPLRLIILGEASEPDEQEDRQAKLTALADELGITNDFALLGFVPNPFAYMARSAVLVLSSVHEGFPNVLVEALACGCPVVSTDCPSGPAEILDNGRFGPLVPVGDDVAMAQAIATVLDCPPAKASLCARA
ncbi:MAG TPA: glycosyltransferase, partial [Candidatus Competibacteraceae bacterium]|nr:glycosyltransferase [Candidatus Competibacteraceae bacterium]